MSQLPLEAGAEKPINGEIADDPPQESQGGVPAVQEKPLTPAEWVQQSDERFAFHETQRNWILSKLVEGVHYGIPPGCEPDPNIDPIQWKARRMLYKAGAQFIAEILKWEPRFEADMDAWKQGGGVAGTHYRKCTLYRKSDHKFIGEGNGMGQVGAKRRDGNAAIKVGNKCALSDAILNATGLSDLFTQDGPEADEEKGPAKSAAASRTGKKPPSTETANAVKAINALYGAWCMAANLDTKDKEAKEGFGAWAESILQRSVPPATEITVKETGVLAAWFKANGVAKRVNE